MAMQGTLKILVRKLSSATEYEETLECYSQCYREPKFGGPWNRVRAQASHTQR